jgi:hypothetical protein
MPTRKQRRRRAKEHRHEYVWEDDEGNELAPEEVKDRKTDAPSARDSMRPGREPQAPSWSRVLRRGVIFAPVMFVVIMLLSSNLTLAEQLVQTAIIVAIFIPFSYLLDGFMYRSFQRRQARARKSTDDGRGS